jgi:2',3'-cyclic-nucleotide 2'-phosphodiesterase (5'-nucleotidase family)
MKKSFLTLALLSVFSFSALAAPAPDLVILHTNDLHSMFEGTGPDSLFTPDSDGDPVRGHFARLVRAIRNERRQATTQGATTLLVDAGDFYGGTLFQILGPDPEQRLSPEVSFLIRNEYDWVAIGNHEFDAGEAGLLTMLEKERANLVGENSVLFGSTNMIFPEGHKLKQYIHPRKVIETPHGKIGLLALLGPDGSRVSAPLRDQIGFVGFDDMKMKVRWNELLKLLRDEVKLLREKEGVRFVVAVMHAGHPEDIKIAEEVPGIDVIVAGHTHQAYPEVLNVNQTWISQSGAYGVNLGRLHFKIEDDKLVLINQGKHLLPITDDIRADRVWHARILQTREKLDKKILRDQPYEDLVSSSHLFNLDRTRVHRDEDWIAEVTNLVREQYEIETNREIAFYFTSKALVRAGLEAPVPETPVLLSDLFRVLALSTEHDELYGAQTAYFHFNKRDTRKLIRFLFFYRRLSRAFNPSFSSDITYDIPRIRIPYFREVTNLRWRGLPYSKWPELFPIATNSIVANYFPKVDSMSKGLVKFTARDSEGSELKTVKFETPREILLLSRALQRKYPLPQPQEDQGEDYEAH